MTTLVSVAEQVADVIGDAPPVPPGDDRSVEDIITKLDQLAGTVANPADEALDLPATPQRVELPGQPAITDSDVPGHVAALTREPDDRSPANGDPLVGTVDGLPVAAELRVGVPPVAPPVPVSIWEPLSRSWAFSSHAWPELGRGALSVASVRPGTHRSTAHLVDMLLTAVPLPAPRPPPLFHDAESSSQSAATSTSGGLDSSLHAAMLAFVEPLTLHLGRAIQGQPPQLPHGIVLGIPTPPG